MQSIHKQQNNLLIFKFVSCVEDKQLTSATVANSCLLLGDACCTWRLSDVVKSMSRVNATKRHHTER